jgi:peroxiredoxin
MLLKHLVALTVATQVLGLLPNPSPISAFGLPERGVVLPAFYLPSPAIEEDKAYLGVQEPHFRLVELKSRLVLVEIIGVYCPLCHQQAPRFNKLFALLNRRGLGSQVKMLAIAAGGTSMEAEFLRQEGLYNYPVVTDESFAVHELLGNPKTPFTILVNGEGKVLFTHQGVIEEPDALYQEISKHLR